MLAGQARVVANQERRHSHAHRLLGRLHRHRLGKWRGPVAVAERGVNRHRLPGELLQADADALHRFEFERPLAVVDARARQ